MPSWIRLSVFVIIFNMRLPKRRKAYFDDCDQTAASSEFRKSGTSSRQDSIERSSSLIVGSYSNYTVAVKFLDRETMDLSSEDLLELKAVRRLANNNNLKAVTQCRYLGWCNSSIVCWRWTESENLHHLLNVKEWDVKACHYFKISLIAEGFSRQSTKFVNLIAYQLSRHTHT